MSRPFARLILALASCLALSGEALAEPRLYGTNPFKNDESELANERGLFHLDYASGAIVDGRTITLPGYKVTGALAITADPTTGTLFALLKAESVSGRLLATIDVETGVAQLVGNLGDQFSSLAFRADGQLFGVTGDGATVRETLYLIDKATAAKTLARALGNGADGEVIAYNPGDDHFYHWSGNSTVVFEKISAMPPYDITPILTGSSIGGEVFGAVWDPAQGKFLAHNISNYMRTWTTTGDLGPALPSTTTNVRGMALVDVLPPTAANLRVGFSGPSLPVRSGTRVPVYLRVDNYGPDAAYPPTVSITSTAPAGSVSITAPAGWTCQGNSEEGMERTTVPAPSIIADPGTAFVCVAGGNMPRGTIRLGFQVTAPANPPGGFVGFNASVESLSTDPQPGNNTASFKLYVKASASIAPVAPTKY